MTAGAAAIFRPDLLSGRVALVTGGGTGIGFGIASCLAAAGATVAIASRKPEHLESAATQLRESGARVSTVETNVREPEGVARMISHVTDEHGRLDILVNNAGIQHVAPVTEFPPAKWDQILAINLTSAFHTIRLALPAMRAGGFGRIVNIASAHGLVASPYKSAYVAAKHGIVGLTKTIALEVAEEPITCNAVCPGYVATPLVEKQIDQQAVAHGISREKVVRDVLLAQQPNKRFATVEEMGALVVFLASTAAASITGTAIPVDGGWTAH
jgi:3-hydroxybutyrate dehydrogenase